MHYIELIAEIIPLEIGREVLIAQLAEINYESFVEEESGVKAYIQEQYFNEEKVNELITNLKLNFKITCSISTIKEQNWNEVWEQNFDPIIVENKCIVRAPFHEKINEIKYDIIIMPKMSFGTGHHATTYLMLKRLLTLNLEKLSVLDMGCGTGVLAILAKMKGANKVVAVDIDEWAYKNTIENIKNNGLADISVYLGGIEQSENQCFDVILANINRNTLLQDVKHYAKILKSQGNLLLSGFYNNDKEILIAEAKRYKLSLSSQDEKNDWIMLHFINNNIYA